MKFNSKLINIEFCIFYKLKYSIQTFSQNNITKTCQIQIANIPTRHARLLLFRQVLCKLGGTFGCRCARRRKLCAKMKASQVRQKNSYKKKTKTKTKTLIAHQRRSCLTLVMWQRRHGAQIEARNDARLLFLKSDLFAGFTVRTFAIESQTERKQKKQRYKQRSRK